MFFTLKLIKNVIFNKTKNTRVVSFFIYMYSMCVQLFTRFEVPTGCIVIRTLVRALKSNVDAISMETNFEKKIIFFSIFFILIIINT